MVTDANKTSQDSDPSALVTQPTAAHTADAVADSLAGLSDAVASDAAASDAMRRAAKKRHVEKWSENLIASARAEQERDDAAMSASDDQLDRLERQADAEEQR